MRIFNWMKQELIHALPAIIYFLCAFNFIHFTGTLMRSPYEVHYFTYLSMSVDALIMAKAMIIADSLSCINAFPNKPLIYNIVWKCLLYGLFVFLIWSTDALLHLYWHHHVIQLVWTEFIEKLSTAIFIGSLLWVWVLLFFYVVCSEVIIAIGKDKILHLLFG